MEFNIFDIFKDGLGYPASFKTFLRMNNCKLNIEQSKNICIDDVLQLHNWNNKIRSWDLSYICFNLEDPKENDFTNLISSYLINNWKCDIKDISSFIASKSDLKKFNSINEMIEKNSKELIADISEEGFNINIQYKGIDLVQKKSYIPDTLVYHSWDKRIFVNNNDVSHHLGAAQYIAKKLKYDFDIYSSIKIYYINTEILDSICRKYNIYVIPDNQIVDFVQSIKFFGAGFFYKKLPRPYSHNNSIFLPKSNKKSNRIAKLLKDEGIFDFGKYLCKLSNEQIIINI